MSGKRIALALESSGPGGAENMVVRLAIALRERGDVPVLFTMRPGWMVDRARAADIAVEIVPQEQGLALGWIPKLALRLRRERFALLHTHEFTMNVYGGAAARLTGMPTLATIHGPRYVSGAPRRIWAYRVLNQLGMPIVAVSRDLARYLSEGLKLPPEAIDIVHNGVPIGPDSGLEDATTRDRQRQARRSIGVPEEGSLVVAVGNLYPVKDHATLLRAVAPLAPVRVAIAGRGDEEAALRALARELGMADRLFLLGLRDDVGNVLAAGDIFAQPSKSEGLPLAILEAMAAGLPVVATRVGGVAEAVVDGVTGHLVAPEDPEALCDVLRPLFAEPAHAGQLGEAGRRRVRDEFSIGVMADRYRAIYRRLGALTEAD